MKRLRRRIRRRHRFKPYSAVAFLIIGLVASLLFYLQPSPVKSVLPSPARALGAKHYVLKLNGPITASSAGTIIALSDGLFEREGLSVQLRHGIDDADAISTVAADDHVIGLASGEGFLKSRAERLPIVAC